jgi:AraC-like DNA-binding protein
VVAGVKEEIDLHGGHAFRVLRWTKGVKDVEVVLSPGRSVGVAGMGDRWHYHQALELTLFVTGEGTRFVGDRISPFGSGDLVLLGESLPHHWRAHGVSTGISVQWHFPASHPIWSFPETQGLAGFFKAAGRGIHFRGATAALLTAQLKQLLGTSALDRLGLLLRILATMSATPAGDQSFFYNRTFILSVEGRHQAAMQDAMWYLLTHFRDEVRMGQLLKLTRMSKPTFSRQFKAYSGKTLQLFLQDIRLGAACHDLKETDHSIVDCALASGFSQISFFNRLFRRTLKCSPSKFRGRFRSPSKASALQR